MGKGAPSQPDPVKTAAAQAAANKEAVYESARVNQVNQVSPYGTERWSGEIGAPDRTRNISLDPSDQAAMNLMRRVRSGLLGFGNEFLLPQARASLNAPLDFSGLPGISGMDDLAAGAQPLEQATYQRGMNLLQPGFDRQQNDLATNLANRGIPLNSEAYNDALNRLDRSQGGQLENLALSSVGAGRAEQSRLFGLEQSGRQQALSELLTQRSQPINEIAALLQGSPAIQGPAFANPAQYSMQSPDIMGMTQNNYAMQAAQHRQGQSDLMGGLFGLGSAFLGMPGAGKLFGF